MSILTTIYVFVLLFFFLHDLYTRLCKYIGTYLCTYLFITANTYREKKYIYIYSCKERL